MNISFFEEFPTKQNLDKLKLIDFQIKLFLAAKSLEEFNSIKIKNKYVQEVVYWPILKEEEGYWMSPFSSGQALKRTIRELENKMIPILWDAELPWKRTLILTNLIYFFKNKKIIKNFLRNYKGEIYTAEHAYFNSVLRLLGLSFNIKKLKPIKMIYTSMHCFPLVELNKKISKNKYIGLGVLAKGKLQNEKIIKLKQLERDLSLCKKYLVQEVILFRLSGLNQEYKKIIKKFV